jgi:hypothetical protein
VFIQSVCNILQHSLWLGFVYFFVARLMVLSLTEDYDLESLMVVNNQ